MFVQVFVAQWFMWHRFEMVEFLMSLRFKMGGKPHADTLTGFDDPAIMPMRGCQGQQARPLSLIVAESFYLSK